MTNFEKYKDDLIKIEGDFAFDKNTREIAGCHTLDGACEDYLFGEGTCFESGKIKWLYSEYEEPILSDDELELINVLSKISVKEYKYIARSGHRAFLFADKPHIDEYGVLLSRCNHLDISGHIDLFSNIKFTDGLYDIENKCFIEV